ncbi:hypothetical protein [Maridesulfovibrio sp.]|uniref:hypothetical protein n=1 Tax=Maridesulfovibrio sp. TaxID=2795000 RepID=UPI0029F5A5EB|nr:hypothetical protein [Maridesulfovibrio sp.]
MATLGRVNPTSVTTLDACTALNVSGDDACADEVQKLNQKEHIKTINTDIKESILFLIIFLASIIKNFAE